MDLEINKMFLEKNKEIFINNLILETERNLDTLKSTTDNSVALEINKLYIFFRKYFNEIEKKYKRDELLGVLFYERKKYNDIVNSNIEDKKNRVKENLLKLKDEIVSEEYLDKFYENLKDESKIINEKIDLELKKEISLVFVPKVVNKYKIDSPEQIERIGRRISGLFQNTLISRIQEEIRFRDDSLRNMSLESFKKYIELNKETTNN